MLKNSTTTYSDMVDNYKEIDIAEFDGFYKDLLLYLQSKMDFIPIIVLAKPTVRFDELVDGVANDSFDIVMSSIDINAKRNQIVDFSMAIMPGSYRVVVRIPNSIQSNYLSLLDKFSSTIWLLPLAILSYTTVLIWLAEPMDDDNENESSLVEIIIIIRCVINFRRRTNDSHAKTHTGQFLTRIYSTVVKLLFAVYIAAFVSSLLIQDSELTISGIDDIKNGKIPRNRIGIVVGSQIEKYYLNTISQGEKDYYPLKTSDEVYTRLIKGDIDASLWSNISTTYQVNNVYCDLMTVGVEFSHSFYQIPVKKGWLYTADLNFNILSFMESEEFDRISAKWFGRRQCSRTNLFNIETKPVAIRIMNKFIITFASVIMVSLLVHFWSRRNHFISIISRACRTDDVLLRK